MIEQLLNQNGTVGIEHAGAFVRLKYCQRDVILYHKLSLHQGLIQLPNYYFSLAKHAPRLLQHRLVSASTPSVTFCNLLFQFFYQIIYSSVTSCPLPRLNPVQLLLPPFCNLLFQFFYHIMLLTVTTSLSVHKG